MHPLVVAIALVALFGVGANSTAVALDSGTTADSENTTEPEIVDLYPNPPTYGDAGEFVTLQLPAGTNLEEYSLADDHVEVPLSTEEETLTEDKRISFSTDTNVTERYTDRKARPVSDRLQLADRGDTVRLQRNGDAIDKVRYGRATEAEVYDARTEEWEPLGATDKPIATAEGGEVEAFVLPDEPNRAVEFLEASEERIYLAGYTLSSQRVVDALIEADDRGVTVEVLVDGSPVGGMGADTAVALDELSRAGIDVRVIDGDRARYRYHHAKYAVVDDQALVTTENWKPAGTGGQSSRGWATITDQEEIVDGLTRTFHADTGWVDAIPWDEFDDATLVESDPASGTYPETFDSESVAVEQTELLVAPDNADERIQEMIENSDDSLEIKQVQISDRGFPFLQEVIEAAERGVEVRILLSGAWYAEEENTELKHWLEEQADSGDLPLEVRIADPDDEFEKIHAKGVIADESVLVGSINWNNNSVNNNREAALLLDGEEAATYYREVFDADWSDEEESEWEMPVGLALAVLFVAVLAILGAKRLKFEK